MTATEQTITSKPVTLTTAPGRYGAHIEREYTAVARPGHPDDGWEWHVECTETRIGDGGAVLSTHCTDDIAEAWYGIDPTGADLDEELENLISAVLTEVDWDTDEQVWQVVA